MAPRRPTPKSKSKKHRDRPPRPPPPGDASTTADVRQLLADATAKLEQGDPAAAAKIARRAYEHVGDGGRHATALFDLLGHIYVELGEPEDARAFFEKAVDLDPDGELPDDDDLRGRGGGGSSAADKFLWLAQLSDAGGAESVAWYERGAAVLRRQIAGLEASSKSSKSSSKSEGQTEAEGLPSKRRKLAETLCAVAEVYMTDLSWESDAEARCEALVTEAAMLAPGLPDAWQTVANVRISQGREEDARAALARSLALWRDLAPDHPDVPPFPTRISLVRLLIEVAMEETAVEVVDGLVAEDDTSVEAWYLGGYAYYILGERLSKGGGVGGDQTTKEKEKEKEKPRGGEDAGANDGEEWKAAWKSARRWFTQCLKLYQMEEYEDERLGEHAQELLEAINAELGEPPAEGEEDDDDEEDGGWEDLDGEGAEGEDKDEDEDQDEEMKS